MVCYQCITTTVYNALRYVTRVLTTVFIHLKAYRSCGSIDGSEPLEEVIRLRERRDSLITRHLNTHDPTSVHLKISIQYQTSLPPFMSRNDLVRSSLLQLKIPRLPVVIYTR